MSKLNDKKAFLLLEAAISVIILSVGITLVMRSFNSAIGATKVLQDYTTAVSLAEEKMLDLRLNGFNSNQSSGSFTDEFKKFSWKIECAPDALLPLNAVNLSVSWDASGLNRSFSLETYIRKK